MKLYGALAQLGAHHTGSVGVRGSNPLCSTHTAFHMQYGALFYDQERNIFMNNKHEPKFAFSALDIIGMVFAAIGLVFLIVGTALTAYGSSHPENVDGDPIVFLLVFGGIGALFLVLGVVFLLLMLRRRALHQQLFAEGHYVMAQVTSVLPNYNVRVNGRTPFVAECSYTDPETGVCHLFQSRNIFFDPTSFLMDAQVPVYHKPGDFRHYYVDVDAVLPQTQRH